MKLNKGREIYLILYSFFILFSPPIIPEINLLLPLAVFSWVSIIFNWNKFYKESLLNKRIISSYGIFCLYYIIIILINTFFNNGIYIQNSFVVIYKILVLLPLQYICSIYFINKAREVNTSNTFLYTLLIKAGIIQSFLSILAFINPSVKEFFINTMSKNTGSDVFFQNTIYSSASQFRFFGFSSTLLDTFGYGMGILCILAVHLGLTYKKKYFAALPLLLIPIVLNSRSGIFIFILALAVYILLSIKKISLKSLIVSFFMLVMVLITLKPLVEVIRKMSPNTLIWISAGFSNLFSFALRNEKTNFEVSDVLFSKQFWTLPKNSGSLIFGTGHNVYGIKEIIGFHSDVGYINQFWVGGIIGSFIITVFVYFIFKTTKNNLTVDDKNEMKILYIVFILMFVMNVKADLLSYNPGMIISMCLLTNFIFISKEK